MSFAEVGWSTLIALLCALVTVGIYVTADTLFDALMYWPLQLIGLVSVGISLKLTDHKIVLFALPVLIVPLGLWILFLVQCAQGNCI